MAQLKDLIVNGIARVVGTLFASTINEGGTNLADKYLGKTAQAADSAKLGGTAASSYATQSWVNGKGYTTNTGTVTSVSVSMNQTTVGTITTSGDIDLGMVARPSDIPTDNNQLTNGAGYITGITKSMVTTALGYTPPTSNTTYSAGDGLVLSGTTFTPNTSFTTSGKNYKVQVDSTTKGLFVNVPWTDNNTTYSAGTGLSLSGTTINHTNSVTAVTTAGLYKVKYDAQGHITGTTAITKSDITGLGIPGSDTTYSVVTTSANGLMSKDDKSKLDAYPLYSNLGYAINDLGFASKSQIPHATEVVSGNKTAITAPFNSADTNGYYKVYSTASATLTLSFPSSAPEGVGTMQYILLKASVNCTVTISSPSWASVIAPQKKVVVPSGCPVEFSYIYIPGEGVVVNWSSPMVKW